MSSVLRRRIVSMHRHPGAIVQYHTVNVDGIKIFYRKSGLLGALPRCSRLPGFSSASHMFRNLIPVLTSGFHLVAPDLSGFGQSDMPRATPSHIRWTALRSSISSLRLSISPGSPMLYRTCFGCVRHSRKYPFGWERRCQPSAGNADWIRGHFSMSQCSEVGRDHVPLV